MRDYINNAIAVLILLVFVWVAQTITGAVWHHYHDAVYKRTEVRQPTRPDCGHLYNVGKSVEWQNCMGVGPKE